MRETGDQFRNIPQTTAYISGYPTNQFLPESGLLSGASPPEAEHPADIGPHLFSARLYQNPDPSLGHYQFVEPHPTPNLFFDELVRKYQGEAVAIQDSQQAFKEMFGPATDTFSWPTDQEVLAWCAVNPLHPDKIATTRRVLNDMHKTASERFKTPTAQEPLTAPPMPQQPPAVSLTQAESSIAESDSSYTKFSQMVETTSANTAAPPYHHSQLQPLPPTVFGLPAYQSESQPENSKLETRKVIHDPGQHMISGLGEIDADAIPAIQAADEEARKNYAWFGDTIPAKSPAPDTDTSL